MIVVACVTLVCMTLLGGLFGVLFHLKAMRATDGEIAALNASLAAPEARLKALEEKLNILNNRSQR